MQQDHHTQHSPEQLQQDGVGVIGKRPAASRHLLCYVLYVQTGKSQCALLCRVYGLHHVSLPHDIGHGIIHSQQTFTSEWKCTNT